MQHGHGKLRFALCIVGWPPFLLTPCTMVIPLVPEVVVQQPLETFASDLVDVESPNATWVPLGVRAPDGKGALVAEVGRAVSCEGVRYKKHPEKGLRVGNTVKVADDARVLVVTAFVVPPRGAAAAILHNPTIDEMEKKDAARVQLQDAPVVEVGDVLRAKGRALVDEHYLRAASPPSALTGTPSSRSSGIELL